MAFLQVDCKSKALGRKAHFNVFLPTDTDEQGVAPYRTLYLLHGIFGNSTSWVTGANIQRYAEAKNVCVVMPDGENGFYLDHPDYMNNFGTYVGDELVKITRSMFPLSHRWEDTWIGGFSMGGFGALRNGLRFADTFGTVIAFSAALILEDIQKGTAEGIARQTPYMRAMFGDLTHLLDTDKDPLYLVKERVASGKPMPRLYLSCGEQDGLLPANEKFRSELEKLGVAFTYRTTPGAHDWDFWEQEIRHVMLNWLDER